LPTADIDSDNDTVQKEQYIYLNKPLNKGIIRILISSASDVIKADEVVQKCDDENGSLSGTENIELIKRKTAFVSEVFDGIRVIAAFPGNNVSYDINNGDFIKLRTEYYSILSAVIIQKWR